MRSTRAFTLIEIVAATALAALLMMTLLSVAASVQRSDRLLRGHELARERHQPLLDLLRHDLAHARRVQSTADRFILTGYGSLDRQTLAKSHHPVRVTYAVIPVGETSALIREQVTPSALSNQASLVELVALDVEQFELRPMRKAPLITEPDREGEPSPTADDPWSPLPAAVAVRIQWSGNGTAPPGPTTEEVVLLD